MKTEYINAYHKFCILQSLNEQVEDFLFVYEFVGFVTSCRKFKDEN